METTRNILIVEDERIIAKDIQNRLEPLGYVVVKVVSTKKDAVEVARKTRPNLVLMDIMLGGKMDGISAAEDIWKKFHIPIVFLTGDADADTIEISKCAEPFGYIVKPLNDRKLHSTIEIALNKYEMGKRLRESEETVRALLNTPIDAVFLLDKEYIILDLNDTAAQSLQKSKDELIGVSAWAFIPPELVKNRKAHIDEVIKTGKLVRFEDEHIGTWNDNV